MDKEQFERGLDTYGATLARWPEPLRAQVSAWLAGSPEAKQAHTEAMRFEQLLAASAPPAMPEGLRERLNQVPHMPAAYFTWSLPPARAAMAIACSLLLGLLLGWSDFDAPDDEALDALFTTNTFYGDII